MIDQERAERAGGHMWRSGREGASYANLPAELRPADVDEAYAAQAEFHRLAIPVHGPIGGWKIATTTKVMQELMGIGHPCAGAIFASRIHQSPARLQAKDYVSLKIEFELAFRLAADLPASSAPFEPGRMLGAVDAVMPAFELVDDRHAVYRETSALSLIADNAWNAGIVLGSPRDPRAVPELDKLAGRLAIGDQRFEGRSDRPLEALAWIADLTAKLGPGLRRGMIVMTGSLIPTKPIAAGESAAFEVAGLGEVRLQVD
jgi:2-keto-4-pentenoate hydratase